MSGDASSNGLLGIPCVLMRGGTSKGPFFLASDLPAEPAARDRLLLDLMGAGHPLQIDGIGGGNPLSSKVAIVDRASRPDADIDYLFAQVKVEERRVDTSPNCGNMLAAAAPFAIEAGLVAGGHPHTQVRIHNVNTGKIIRATVRTPRGRVTYLGDTRIAGVPGRAAPVELAFLDAAGTLGGSLLPTGVARERIGGVDVSCIDCAIPMVMIPAAALGLRGDEPTTRLNGDVALLQRLEAIRIEAGRRMGIPDAGNRVIPKPVLLAARASAPGLRVRYFMPHLCHGALAITGAIGIATAAVTPGTVARSLAGQVDAPGAIILEHPGGCLDVSLEPAQGGVPWTASVVRTARRLFEGRVFAHRRSDQDAPRLTRAA
nr:4-oxalomesaconate tautomerase [Pseudoxanthomonas sp.]